MHMRSRSEWELQSELYLACRARRIEDAEFRRSDIEHAFRLVEVHVVHKIEEFGPELEIAPLAELKVLGEIGIPVLQPRSDDDVPARIAETRLGSGRHHERRHRAATAGRVARVGNVAVRVAGIDHRLGKNIRTVGAQPDAEDVAGQQDAGREPSLELGNAAELPPADDLIGDYRQVRKERFALAEGKLIDVAEDQPVPNVETGKAAEVTPQIPLVAAVEPSPVAVSALTSVIDRLRMRVRSEKLHAVGEAFLDLHLKRVVVGVYVGFQSQHSSPLGEGAPVLQRARVARL